MIDSNDKIFKVLNWINLLGIFFALFLAVVSFVIFKFSIYFSIAHQIVKSEYILLKFFVKF